MLSDYIIARFDRGGRTIVATISTHKLVHKHNTNNNNTEGILLFTVVCICRTQEKKKQQPNFSFMSEPEQHIFSHDFFVLYFMITDCN